MNATGAPTNPRNAIARSLLVGISAGLLLRLLRYLAVYEQWKQGTSMGLQNSAVDLGIISPLVFLAAAAANQMWAKTPKPGRHGFLVGILAGISSSTLLWHLIKITFVPSFDRMAGSALLATAFVLAIWAGGAGILGAYVTWFAARKRAPNLG
jgi:hypothetical protein